jgi:hypothetical protein
VSWLEAALVLAGAACVIVAAVAIDWRLGLAVFGVCLLILAIDPATLRSRP